MFFFMFSVYLFFHVFEELVDSIVDNFFFSVKSVKHIKHSIKVFSANTRIPAFLIKIKSFPSHFRVKKAFFFQPWV